MTTEDKMLLIKDLSCRLPYGVHVQHVTTQFSGALSDIISYPLYDENDNIYDIYAVTNFFGDGDYVYLEYFKPYLFPMSSMTEEQSKEYRDLCETILDDLGYPAIFDTGDSLDWLNRNMFDWRGLIEKGLAINATNKNIY
jgi:hypothetical protein